jgi:hypothetical protein
MHHRLVGALEQSPVGRAVTLHLRDDAFVAAV